MTGFDKRFNPYFNGYSTLTSKKKMMTKVIMTGFNPYFNGYSTLTYTRPQEEEDLWMVSILILMDTLL